VGQGDQNVDLKFRGHDAGVNATIKSVQDNVRRLPESFAKSAAAMNAFGGAAQQLGGKTAKVASKLTGLGALVATGGPVGIAIAAVSLGVTAATKAWEVHRAPIEAAEAAYRSLNGVLADSTKRHDAQQKRIEDLNRELKYWGKTADEARQLELKDAIAKQSVSVPAYEAQTKAAQDRVAAVEQEIAALKARSQTEHIGAKTYEAKLTALKETLAVEKESARNLATLLPENQRALELSKQELNSITQKIALTKADKEGEDRIANAKKRAAEATRDQAKAERERKAAAEDVFEAYARENNAKLASIRKQAAAEKLVRDASNKAALQQRKFAAAGRKESLEKLNAEAEDTERAWAQTGAAIASTMGDAFAMMITDSDNAGKHMTMAVIDAAQAAVMSYAASAAAAAAFSQAGIPIVGPILAVAAAGIVFGLIRAFMSKIPSYATGGVVPGVDTGRDTVVSGLRPGERIFTPEQNERMVKALESGTGGGVHVHNHTVMPPASAETTRQVRQVTKIQSRLRRLGMAVA